MSEEPRRRRAPAMSPEDRREAIVQATLPLVVKSGANVTTSQIAAAAGIAEGTVFRVFKDKAELLDAVIERALLSDDEVAAINAVPSGLALQQRLVVAVSSVLGYLDRMWGVMGALRESGWHPDHDDKTKHKGPPEGMQRISTAVAGIFGDAEMRTTPEHAARLLLGFVFTNRLQGKGFGETTVDPEHLVELFLHGALKPGGKDV
ncbi:TetR/AcrR family transcriptional regulator [Lentzea cavernae]|uniref:TetR/AcrR family transcriptional regulator n=1 Tax=Lentzea cavernae TaxID=2020703 RepID=UPI00174C7C31|nr:TetR/AcrR family transcriptional regulator [Lentzea cavernae]